MASACEFCGGDVARGTENLFVTQKGKVMIFCSSKCEKNLLKLGRKAWKVRWTSAYRAEKAVRTRSEAGKGKDGKAGKPGKEKKESKAELKGKKEKAGGEEKDAAEPVKEDKGKKDSKKKGKESAGKPKDHESKKEAAEDSAPESKEEGQ